MGLTRTEALAIQSQTEAFVAAAESPTNAAARDKLRAEDYTDEEHGRGKALLQEAKDALVDATSASGVRTAATTVQSETLIALMDEFGKRVKKTRAKLQEYEETRLLIPVLNQAIRLSGRSFAALSSRVEAFLKVIDEEVPIPPDGRTLTIRQAVHLTPEQLRILQDALTAFRAQRSSQDGSTAEALEFSAAKQTKLQALDRWLAKWQHIAKADFTRAELVAFGIPINAVKSRRRATPANEPPTP